MKRARIDEINETLRTAKEEKAKLKRELKRAKLETDKLRVAEAWTKTKGWCYANGLAAFWEYANAHKPKFTRAHIDDGKSDWYRYIYGSRMQNNASYGAVATLEFKNVKISLRRPCDLESLSLWVNDVRVLSYINYWPYTEASEFAANGTKYELGDGISTCPQEVLVRASPVQLGALLVRLSMYVEGHPDPDDPNFCIEDVERVVPCLAHDSPMRLFVARPVEEIDD